MFSKRPQKLANARKLRLQRECRRDPNPPSSGLKCADQWERFELISKVRFSFFYQCDEIWRNFATLAKILKVFGQFLHGLFNIWQTFVPTLAFLCSWPNRNCCNGQRLINNNAIWSHCLSPSTFQSQFFLFSKVDWRQVANLKGGTSSDVMYLEISATKCWN